MSDVNNNGCNNENNAMVIKSSSDNNKIANLDFNNLSKDEIDIINQKLMEVKMSRYEEGLIALRDEVSKIKEIQKIRDDEVDNRFEQSDLKYQQQVSVAVNSLRVNQPKYGFVNQGDFGRFFSVSMSSVTVGKMMKVIGIAMKSMGKTTPYRHFIPKYAQVRAYEKYTAVKWHYENCLLKMDEWLESKGLFEAFYSIETENELKNFIDDLYMDCV